MFAYFAYFTYTSYEGAISQAYISLQDTNGQCNPVEITVTGTYLADKQGNWIGSPAFSYSDAQYSLTLSNFEGTNEQYTTMMNFFHYVLTNLGNDALHDNLPYNLARWSSFVRYYSDEDPGLTNFTTIGYGQLQYMQLTGNPQDIFNLEFQQLVMGSQDGYCPVTGFTEYDYANGEVFSSVNYTQFMSNLVCYSTAIPNSLGYSVVLDANIFQIRMEVRAFMTAFAVNTGILPITSLYKAGSKAYNFVYANTSYVAGEYFDIRYADMKPIFCLYNTTHAPPGVISSLCFYIIGSTLALPVFNHFGTNLSQPVYCSCTNGIGITETCNMFNLLSGLLYFPVPLDLTNIPQMLFSQVTFLFKVLMKFPDYKGFNYAAYNATWGAAATAYGMTDPQYATSTWVKNAFAFCNIRFAKCSLATFHFTEQASQYISIYKYSLENGSCSDSFTIPPDEW